MTARTPAAARLRADACPGALQTHAAADGALARVRVPGGLLTGGQLRALAAAARDLGDGALELTSRGNVQLRGLADGVETDLGDRLTAAGLLPSASHERVRNVLASALTGRAGGHVDVRPWVRALDAGICADPALAALPGRYLATLDDGRGDVAGLGGDVGLLALSSAEVALTLAGTDSGRRAHPDDAVALALAATRAFLAEREAQGSTAWRLAELTDGPRRVAERISPTGERHLAGVDRSRGPGGPVPGPAPSVRGAGRTGSSYRPGQGQRLGATGGRHVAAVSPGERRCDDGRVALVAVVPLGRLDAAQADLLARLADEVQLTPWRSVVVPDLTDGDADDAAAALRRTGMVFDADSPWTRVSACAGRPGCAKSLADVRADVGRAVADGALPAGGVRQHWAGCERRCGRPRGEVVDVVATGTGYRVGWS
jgi:precorrin-3B synthase